MSAQPTTSDQQSPPLPKKDGMRWWTRIIAFFVLTAVIGEVTRRTGVPALTVAVVAGCAWVALRFVVAQYSDVAPPVEPQRPVAELPHTRPEPPRTIPILADTCAICGRALTNPDSRRAGVGTECIKVHGPRPQVRPNPDRDRWNEEMAAARAEQAEQQVALDQVHRIALSEHRNRLTAWGVAMSSTEGRARSRTRRRVKMLRTFAGIAVWVALLGHLAQ